MAAEEKKVWWEEERKLERQESSRRSFERLRHLAKVHGFVVERCMTEDVVAMFRVVERGLVFRYLVTTQELADAHDVEVLVGQAVNAYEAAMVERKGPKQPPPPPIKQIRQPESWWRRG